MATIESVHLETTRDFEIQPKPAGGFILKQHFTTDEKDSAGDRIFYRFERAFSTPGDLIDFINESYNFPRHITSQVYERKEQVA